MVYPMPPMSDETKAKIAASNTGRTHTLESRMKMSASQKGHSVSEETRAKMSASHTGKVKSAETRANISEALRGVCSPAKKAHLDRIRQPKKNPELPSKKFKSGAWGVFGEQLRVRDGDLCQLCLTTINFELPALDPMARSVDHITPTYLGGSDEIDNLWIAHRICNQKKGPNYVGRTDGTVDVRR